MRKLSELQQEIESVRFELDQALLRQERYMMFQKSGFNVITRDENRSIDETFALAESMFGLNR